MPTLEWLCGHSEEEIAAARQKFVRLASGKFAVPDERLALAFDECWAAIALFVEARGKDAVSPERLQRRLGRNSAVDRVIKLQLKAAQAVDALSPHNCAIWANRLATGYGAAHGKADDSGIRPGGVLLISRLFGSRTLTKALKAYTKKRTRKRKATGNKKDRAKIKLLKCLIRAWADIIGGRISVADAQGELKHFLDLLLPLANHKLRVSLSYDKFYLEHPVGRRVFAPAIGGKGQSDLTEHASGAGDATVRPKITELTIGFQEECVARVKKQVPRHGRDHPLVGSVVKWIKENKLAATGPNSSSKPAKSVLGI